MFPESLNQKRLIGVKWSDAFKQRRGDKIVLIKTFRTNSYISYLHTFYYNQLYSFASEIFQLYYAESRTLPYKVENWNFTLVDFLRFFSRWKMLSSGN